MTAHRKHAPDQHTLVVKGLTPREVELLDAITSRRREELAERGATTSRNAVIVTALRDFITRTICDDGIRDA